MEEIWKPIKGYEGFYEVSNLGRIKALSRKVLVSKNGDITYYRKKKEHIMSQPYSSNGYKQICLSKNGKTRLFRVHRLVAEAFIENPDRLPEVNHIDESRDNNRADNLEWCTHKYNNRYGNKPPKGEKNPRSKLTAEDVIEIRKRRASGETLISIARAFGISQNHVSNIARGERWKHEISPC